MRKRMIALGVMCAIGFGLMTPVEKGFAAEKSVRVTLPKFSVHLNNHKVDNQYREYPLLVYKDMTYFPMTWYDSRLLGLETEWSQEDGLKIEEGNVTSSYEPYKTKSKNGNSYAATVPSFRITVNGKAVDNSKEEYPLLNFKNVTYFPLTWKFAHDAFGWEYTWNDKTGLAINSDNQQVKAINLPKYAGENDVAVFEGYYYFVETVGHTNNVYRAAENNISKKELVYAYEIDQMYGFQNQLRFEIRDNQLWFFYHRGGAVMGSDVYCKVNDDGKATMEQNGYLDFRNTSKGVLKIYQGGPPSGNNLALVASSQQPEGEKRIGDPNLIYGWNISVEGGGQSYGGNRSTTVIGDDIYILGAAYPPEKGKLNQIYKVNLSTNETTRIIDSEVRDFKIINNMLYYVKDGGKGLYTSNLEGTNEKKLSDDHIENYIGWFAEIDSNVYYTVSIGEEQFNLYKADSLKEDSLVLEEPVERIEIIDNKIVCKLPAGEDYGIKIFDKSGNPNLAITDQISHFSAYKDKILMVSAKDKSIKLVQ
ncbi:DUF5050 domain-containing protein [Anaerosolibacter sp.]|uniref:DUF5050 domain-containing protein n=1 Tax=Anaerosolibacter sp. TaxID=1872527 RepID=UPI0039F0C3ED